MPLPFIPSYVWFSLPAVSVIIKIEKMETISRTKTVPFSMHITTLNVGISSFFPSVLNLDALPHIMGRKKARCFLPPPPPVFFLSICVKCVIKFMSVYCMLRRKPDMFVSTFIANLYSQRIHG